MSTAVTEDDKQGSLVLSTTEDNHYMVSADTMALERQSPFESNATVETAPIEIPGPNTTVPEEIKPLDPEYNELPETSTSYKMTEELFRAAKNAEPGSRDSFWSHNLYRRPQIGGKPKKPTVHYCKSLLTTERVLQTYFMDQKVIGFDIEWKADAYKSSDARKNISLVQIASEERIALFHIAMYPKSNELADLVAPSLKKILEDPEITKVGVSIKADCTRVRNYLKIDPKGLFELSHLHKLVKFSNSKNYKEIDRRLVSLAKQTQEHLHLPMYKGEVRSSDWSKPLVLEQIMYAASDSYAGLQLYATLELKRKALDPTPPRPYHAELNLPIRLAEGVEIPSDGEADEIEPDDPAPIQIPKRKYTTDVEELTAATDSIEMEDAEPNSALEIQPPPGEEPTFTKNQTALTKFPELTPQSMPVFSTHTSPLVHEAEVLASCHMDLLSRPRNFRHNRSQNPSSPPSSMYLDPSSMVLNRGRNLRTYFLWANNPSLKLEEIGSMLRSPPISTRNVAIMILEAVRTEKLPYEKERLRDVLAKWRTWGARYVVSSRYKRLEEACEFQVGDGEEAEERIEKV